jgi:PAS domain S-box-containing protein
MNPQSASPVAHSPRTPRGAAPLAARIASLEHALAQKQQALDDLQAEMKRTTDFIREVDRVLPGALLGVDARGFVFSANDAAVRLLGHDRDELLGKAFAEIQVEPAFTGEALTALLGERRVVSHERTWLDRLGHRIPVQLSLAASGGPDEAPPMYICVAADLRERRRMELEIRQTAETRGRRAARGRRGARDQHARCSTSATACTSCGRRSTISVAGRPGLPRQVARVSGERNGLGPVRLRAPSSTSLWAEADLDFVMEHAGPAFARAVDGVSARGGDRRGHARVLSPGADRHAGRRRT